jgi:hypothetical protein
VTVSPRPEGETFSTLTCVSATDQKLFAFLVRMSLQGATFFEASREFRGGEHTLIWGPNHRQICRIAEETR